MSSLTARIKKRIQMTINNFKSDCHFSLYYALLRIADEIGGRIHLNWLASVAHAKKDEWIFKYLKKQLSPIIDNYSSDSNIGEYNKNALIWICWWNGLENAPKLVQQCINSIKNNSNNHSVVLITENNYNEYLEIPDYMLSKIKTGQMKLAHLSDYIRVSLLARYGGLWIDSTIFCTQTISEEYFNVPFFTCKSEPQNCKYLSQMRWTTFFMAGWKGNVFFRYLKEAFEIYWKNADCAIDYLFFDYLIELGYKQIPEIKRLIDQVPNNNIHRDDLQAAMNASLPSTNFTNIIQQDTSIYKLSWRETYQMSTNDNKESVYSYFLNMKL